MITHGALEIVLLHFLRDTRAVLGFEVIFVAEPDGTRVELMTRAG